MVPRSNASGRVSLLVPTCRFHDKIGVACFFFGLCFLRLQRRRKKHAFTVAKNAFWTVFFATAKRTIAKNPDKCQIYALSGITWVTVAKNAPPIKLCPSNTSYVGERSSLGFVIW